MHHQAGPLDAALGETPSREPSSELRELLKQPATATIRCCSGLPRPGGWEAQDDGRRTPEGKVTEHERRCRAPGGRDGSGEGHLVNPSRKQKHSGDWEIRSG